MPEERPWGPSDAFPSPREELNGVAVANPQSERKNNNYWEEREREGAGTCLGFDR